LAVFQHLPQSNCKRCGPPNCFTFVLQVATDQAGLEACPALAERQHAQHLAALQAMLIDIRSEV
jgi:ArsR family metal-binding transcriptional regulator